MNAKRSGSIVTAVAWILVSAGVAVGADSALVAWWSLDDGSGTVAKDSVGGNHGVLMEGPGKGSTDAGTEGHGPNWIAGKLGRALSFDGVNDYVNLAPTGSGLPTVLASLTDCTFTVWANFQHNGGNWQRIWELSDTGANVIFLSPCQATSGPMRFGINAGSGGEQLVDAPTTLPAGWHHITITIDQVAAGQSTYTMYLDSIRVGQNVNGTLVPARPVGTGAFTRCWLGRPRWQNDDYYSGAIDDFRVFNKALSQVEIQAVMLSQAGAASAPNPDDEATDVPRDTILSWTPGEYAATHDVYFGTVFEDVNAAGRSDPRGVQVSRNQDVNAFDPAGLLELGRTYYWRIDEVNAAPDNTVFKGSAWSFTVEPRSYPLTGVTATASSSSKVDTGPERTVDGSGLSPNGEHSITLEHMWLSGKGAGQWIQYALGKDCKLDKMLVWNSNQSLEGVLGFGAKNVKIEHSVDGANWTALGEFEFARAPGLPTYTANTTVDFGGVLAGYVKLTINSNWGGVFQQYSLSEVRFFAIPVGAREPSPASGATNVLPQVTLRWRAGREAVSHQVYLGTDPQAVTGGAVAPVTVDQPQYEVPADLNQTYYWKVVEVNQAESPTAWDGDVWSFSTPQYLVVDDFESYTNDSPNRVFQTWTDGAGFSADESFPNGGSGNGTGSLVGYDPAAGNIMERAIIHGGMQSMPLFYSNDAAPRYSEAERAFETPQDWSKHGITTLVLWFRGDVNNVGAPFYVKINGTKVVYSNGAASTAIPLWKQWNIDLAPFGAALKSVKTLAIGVGNGTAGGTGTLFIDDIALYAAAPQAAAAADPGTNGLAALYSFEGNVQDSSGKNLHGTANGEPAYGNGPFGMGRAVTFDGANDYVDLPIGTLVSTLNSCSFSTWIYCGSAGGAAWQRIFDFGSSNTVYMFLTSFNGARNRLRFAITTGGNTSGSEQIVNGPAALPVGWHHVAVVIDSQTMALRLYQDGVLAASGTTTVLPKDLGVTTQNWLGRSQYTTDPYLTGSVDELRIFNRALSEGEVRYLAGDR